MSNGPSARRLGGGYRLSRARSARGCRASRRRRTRQSSHRRDVGPPPRRRSQRRAESADADARVGRPRRCCEGSRDDRFVVAYADQLLRCGEPLQGAQIAHRDRAIVAAIERLLHDVEYATAASIAERYLDLPAGRGSRALAARLAAATALIASGDVGRGRATLLAVIDEARITGDQLILADAILAAGPLTTGGHERRAVLEDAERLVATLPADASSQRIQLACWAAHHWLLRGDRLRAEMLLATVDKDPRAGSDPVLEGLVLAIRAGRHAGRGRTAAGPPFARGASPLRQHPSEPLDTSSGLPAGWPRCLGARNDLDVAVGAEPRRSPNDCHGPMCAGGRWRSRRRSNSLSASQSGRRRRSRRRHDWVVSSRSTWRSRPLRPTAAPPARQRRARVGRRVASSDGNVARRIRGAARRLRLGPCRSRSGRCSRRGGGLLRQDCRLLVSVGSAWPQVAMCAGDRRGSGGPGAR